MGGQRGETPEEVAKTLRKSHLVARIGEIQAARAANNASYAEKIRPYELERDVANQPLDAEETALINELVGLIEQDAGEGVTLTLKLPAGDVTLTTSGSALEVTDMNELMAIARKERKLTRVSQLKPREPQKTMIKSAIKNFPRFYQKVKHLLVQPKKTSVVIKPRNYGGEIKRDIRTINVPYPAPQSVIEPTTPSS